TRARASQAIAKATEAVALVVDPSLKPGGKANDRPAAIKKLADGLKSLAVAIRVFGDTGKITDADPDVVRKVQTQSDKELHREGDTVPTEPPDSIELFVHPPAPKDKNARWAHVANKAVWDAPRQALHEQLLAEAMEQAGIFAETAAPGGLHAMRGNTAAGKSRAVKKDAEIGEALKKAKNAAVNPDNFKVKLMSAGGLNLTSTQVHAESSTLATWFE